MYLQMSPTYTDVTCIALRCLKWCGYGRCILDGLRQTTQQGANLKEYIVANAEILCNPKGDDNSCQTSCFIIFGKPLQNALKEGCVQHLGSCFPSAKAQFEEVSKGIALIRTPGVQRQTLCPYSWSLVQKYCKRSDFVLSISVYGVVSKGSTYSEMAVCQNLVPQVNIKIAGKWMFIPLKMVLIGIDPYPNQ